jgi:hypothetical protein
MNKDKLIIILLIIFLFMYLNKIDFFSNIQKIQYIHIVNNNIIKDIDINDNLELKLNNLKKPVVYIQGSIHGNEPSGTDTCNKILNDIKNNNFIKFKGTIIIFPYPNILGYTLGIRWALKDFNLDINRNFVDKGKCKISKKIIETANKSDFIIDLHEGYSYHLKNKNSIGSTLSVNTDRSKEFAGKIINKLNDNININYKKFSLNNPDPCFIDSALRCYFKNKDYILVETTGQNNIQPIEIRVNQMYLIITNVLIYLNDL